MTAKDRGRKCQVTVGHEKRTIDGTGVGNYLGFVGQEVDPIGLGQAQPPARARTVHRMYTRTRARRVSASTEARGP